MKKIIISSALVIAIAAYVIYQHVTGQATVPAAQNTAPNPQTTTSTPAASGEYKDGTYTGSVADAYYGSLQVQAVVKGGALADVVFLQYPSDAGHTIELSRSSMPVLKSEAIQAQSANVNIISGATQTSEAFQKSLAAALALAKN